jgi:AcrR family transcriptional regulator
MSPRKYQMDRRAEAAADTRKRIVEATYLLHAEKGVAGTTFRDIAARADVGMGTVYHHFPTYEDVITACGNHAMTLARPPYPGMFDGVHGVSTRIALLVRELFAFYSRMPAFGRVRSERHQFASLEQQFGYEEQNRRALIEEALRGTRTTAAQRALIFALLDFQAYQTLANAGLVHEAAVDEITTTILARLRAKKRSSE